MSQSAVMGEKRHRTVPRLHENLFFSKYDVVFSVDEQEIANLPHGENGDLAIDLTSGNHIVSFKNAEKGTPLTTLELYVDREMTAYYRIECKSDEIQIINPNNELQKRGIEYDLALKEKDKTNWLSPSYLLIDFDSNIQTHVNIFRSRKTGKTYDRQVYSTRIDVESREKWKTQYVEYKKQDDLIYLYPLNRKQEDKHTAEFSIEEINPILDELYLTLSQKDSQYLISNALDPSD